MKVMAGWLVCRRTMPDTENSLFPSKLRSSASCSFFGQSFSFGHCPSIHQQAGKGFLYFKTLRIISQSERTKDCSCTFYGFFIVSLC